MIKLFCPLTTVNFYYRLFVDFAWVQWTEVSFCDWLLTVTILETKYSIDNNLWKPMYFEHAMLHVPVLLPYPCKQLSFVNLLPYCLILCLACNNSYGRQGIYYRFCFLKGGSSVNDWISCVSSRDCPLPVICKNYSLCWLLQELLFKPNLVN